MKKTVAKVSTKKKSPTKKVVALKAKAKRTSAPKAKPASKGNVVAFKAKPTSPKKQWEAPKQEKAPAPQPKQHPFANFMKDRWSGKSFSAQNHKLGSQSIYRRKAV